MDIKLGEFVVYSSGSVIGIENEPLDFIFTEDLIIRLQFHEDGTKKPTSSAERFGRKGLKITFKNMNRLKGEGNSTPIKVGILNKRELLLSFRIFTMASGNGGKLFVYTWLLGKEVQNG